MSRTPTPPAPRERKAKARVRFTGGHHGSRNSMPWLWPLVVFGFMITLMVMWEGGMRSAIFGTLDSISQIRRAITVGGCGTPRAINDLKIKMERIADKDPWIQQQYAIYEIKRNGAALRDHIHEEHGERARTLHLAGAGDMSLKLAAAQQLATLLFQWPGPSLHTIPCCQQTDDRHIIDQIAGQLRNCPKSIIILHQVDELPLEVLFKLERLFEESTWVDFEDKRGSSTEEVDLTKAIFILTSSIGAAQLTQFPITFSQDRHTEIMTRLKKAVSVQWASRPAFAGRISESHIPFIEIMDEY